MTDGRISLVIDGREVQAAPGTLLVDAAKQAGVNIPVFCYHPKLEPVGMCRMCLVEIGRPEKDKATGDWVRDAEGKPVVRFSSKLETACTTPVGEGWEVRVQSPAARLGRQEIIEFLLTSHPLDCPICDKGGECPLQELTMDHGAGKSRFLFADKVDLAKRLPLGDLIYLDRERCIQCARCTRFQEELVGDPVIGFEQRGRELQIVTYSTPGFASVFSGNTTDICPVGALTTADFRFEARPWELSASTSICPHCPVGCNLTVHVRREPEAAGRVAVQRILPRQNEQVNEIWICDKGRFAHHFAESGDRLLRPRLRKGEEWVEVDWGEALQAAADGLRKAGTNVVALAGGRASNEDLYSLQHLARGVGGRAHLYEVMGGGSATRSYGVAPGTNLGTLGAGDAVLVLAADLIEEAPVWWLRLRQAARRGAAVIVAHARPTRTEAFARVVLRYAYGEELALVSQLTEGLAEAGNPTGALGRAVDAIRQAQNLLVFFGGEGMDPAGSSRLAEACARLIDRKGTVGRERNGVIGVWPRPNSQGAWDAGLEIPASYSELLRGAGGLLVMACDPAGDDPALAEALDSAGFVVVMDLFLTATAQRADVVLPSASFLEREGTYTSGERRVQRLHPALPPLGQARPDWRILGELATAMGQPGLPTTAAEVFQRATEAVPDYAGLTYSTLGEAAPQWPPVGGPDVYFGGTASKNRQGTGRPARLVPDGRVAAGETPSPARGRGALRLIPIHRLFDRGTTIQPSSVLAAHLVGREVWLNPEHAARLGIAAGDEVEVVADGSIVRARASIDSAVPRETVLAPRSAGFPFPDPTEVEVRRP